MGAERHDRTGGDDLDRRTEEPGAAGAESLRPILALKTALLQTDDRTFVKKSVSARPNILRLLDHHHKPVRGADEPFGGPVGFFGSSKPSFLVNEATSPQPCPTTTTLASTFVCQSDRARADRS